MQNCILNGKEKYPKVMELHDSNHHTLRENKPKKYKISEDTL